MRVEGVICPPQHPANPFQLPHSCLPSTFSHSHSSFSSITTQHNTNTYLTIFLPPQTTIKSTNHKHQIPNIESHTKLQKYTPTPKSIKCAILIKKTSWESTYLVWIPYAAFTTLLHFFLVLCGWNFHNSFCVLLWFLRSNEQARHGIECARQKIMVWLTCRISSDLKLCVNQRIMPWFLCSHYLCP